MSLLCYIVSFWVLYLLTSMEKPIRRLANFILGCLGTQPHCKHICCANATSTQELETALKIHASSKSS